MTVYYTKMREILCKIGMVNKMNNKKIKVLHLELDEHLGGIESFLYNLYNAIDREKFNLILYQDQIILLINQS